MNRRIAHLTSVHPRGDTRIFEKECRSIAWAGYDVHLVVADSKGDCTEQGVKIHDAGSSRGRIARMSCTVARVFRKASALDADLYHLHDPELIPAGLLLKRRGAKVVFDCHEDIPLQLLSKPYMPSVLRKPVASLYRLFEHRAYRKFDALITVTPLIASKLMRLNSRTVIARNYPLVEGVGEGATPAVREGQAKLVYVGSISRTRGILEMVQAMELLNGEVTLDLVGSFVDASLYREVKAQPGWRWVNELGWLSRDAVASTLSQAKAGLVLIHPTPNYVEALPTKLFEYMAAGLPVISSDFELWREIIDGCECGICVDPLNPAAIARAVRHLLDSNVLCAAYGRNGRKAVLERYNWTGEADRLLQLYDDLLSVPSGMVAAG